MTREQRDYRQTEQQLGELPERHAKCGAPIQGHQGQPKMG